MSSAERRRLPISAAVYGTMSALKRMLPRDRGTIVQVGSALSCRTIPLQAPYCGAKHGETRWRSRVPQLLSRSTSAKSAETLWPHP